MGLYVGVGLINRVIIKLRTAWAYKQGRRAYMGGFTVSHCGKILISIFQQFFTSIEKKFILGQRLGTML